MTVAKIREGLRKKEFSALEICREYLERIDREDKKLSAFLTVDQEKALSRAKEIDKMVVAGLELPPLAGVPFGVKDVILVKDIRCTAGSRILENYIASYDATAIKRLKDAGAILLGKTNLDEFAMGSSTENSAFGPTKNPHDLKRVPGGSSGGSSSAVAADLCVFALGSDTGGSIRLPASFCGVVGLKPTYGAVSRYGLIAFASSLDQIGPITKTVEDCEMVFNVIKGKDELDSTSVKSRISNFEFRISNLRIGIPKEYFIEGIDKEVEQAVRTTIKKYEGMGAEIVEISLPHTKYALACYYIIATSEASANLARYDAVRYGKIQNPITKIQTLFDHYLTTRGLGFGAEVRRRIMLGTFALSSGYYEAYYLRAQKVRTKVKEDFDKAFERVDIIFAPVSPTTAFLLGEKIADPLTMYLSDIFTVAVNLAGLPAVSVPCGKAHGLPVGLQIIGKPFEENKILASAKLL